MDVVTLGMAAAAAKKKIAALEEKNVLGRGRIGTGISNGTDTSQTSRTRMVVRGDVVGVRLVFVNFYLPAGGAEPVGGSDVTVKASVENPALLAGDPTGAATIPVYFNGRRTAVMESGGILISDPVHVNVADGSPIWVRSMPTVTAGGKWVNSATTFNSATAGTDGSGVLEGIVTNVDSVDSGTIAGSTSFAFAPVAILGVAASRKPSVLIVGDSIAADTGVIRSGEVGYLARACINAGYPLLRIAEGGERVLTVVNAISFYKRMRLARMATHAICQYGTNDIYGSGRTLAQLKADSLTLWKIMARTGLTTYQTTVLPRPGASTDGYMTVAGQSITDATKEGIRVGFNTWLRDTTASGAVAQSAGTLRGMLDPCTPVEVNAAGALTMNGGFWAAAGAVVTTGTATSFTTNVITDTGAARTVSADIALTLAIMTATTGAGQSCEISANTATAWTLLAAITLPTGTVTYQVGPSYCYDGTHPTEAAHQLIGNALNLATLIPS